MHIEPFFDPESATFTYIVSDPSTNLCAIIDSVYTFDIHSGMMTTVLADKLIDYVKKENLTVQWILETHIHADHLTAATYLKSKLGGKIAIGENVTKTLSYWIPVFNSDKDTPKDGSQFDVLFKEGEQFKIGTIDVKVIYTPGHTLDAISYYMPAEKAVFVGDTILMPYVGTARTDFPGGGADMLYHSIQKILALPDDTRIYTCHDYPPQGQAPACEATVLEQKKTNNLINEKVTLDEYVTNRNKRDFNKPVPRLLFPSLQYNIRAGSAGNEESNKTKYIKIPLNKKL